MKEVKVYRRKLSKFSWIPITIFTTVIIKGIWSHFVPLEIYQSMIWGIALGIGFAATMKSYIQED